MARVPALVTMGPEASRHPLRTPGVRRGESDRQAPSCLLLPQQDGDTAGGGPDEGASWSRLRRAAAQCPRAAGVARRGGDRQWGGCCSGAVGVGPPSPSAVPGHRLVPAQNPP